MDAFELKVELEGLKATFLVDDELKTSGEDCYTELIFEYEGDELKGYKPYVVYNTFDELTNDYTLTVRTELERFDSALDMLLIDGLMELYDKKPPKALKCRLMSIDKIPENLVNKES